MFLDLIPIPNAFYGLSAFSNEKNTLYPQSSRNTPMTVPLYLLTMQNMHDKVHLDIGLPDSVGAVRSHLPRRQSAAEAAGQWGRTALLLPNRNPTTKGIVGK